MLHSIGSDNRPRGRRAGKQPSLWQDLQAFQLVSQRQLPVKADALQGPCPMILNQQQRAKLTCIGGANRMSRQ